MLLHVGDDGFGSDLLGQTADARLEEDGRVGLWEEWRRRTGGLEDP